MNPAALIDWTSVGSDVAVWGIIATAGIIATWWRKPMMDLAVSTFGLCRATRANTREVSRLGVENAMILDQNRIMLDHLGVAYAYTDAKGRVLDVSDAWVEMSGCSRDEALAGNWTKYIAPADAEAVTRKFFDNLKSDTPIAYAVDFQFIRSRSVIRATVDPIKRHGKVIGYRGMNRVLIADPLDDKTVSIARKL